MNTPRLVAGWQKRTFGITTQLIAQLIFLVFACASSLFGQAFVTEYVNVSVANDGTIYATGITDGGNMAFHSADVTTTITSPRGRQTTSYNSVSSGGYVRSDTYLPFVQADFGDYFITANGSAFCRIAQAWAYAGVSTNIFGFGIHEFAYSLVSMNPTFTVGHYNRCNAGRDCPGPDLFASDFGGVLPQHCTVKWLTYTNKTFSFEVCVFVSGAIQTQCMPDPLP